MEAASEQIEAVADEMRREAAMRERYASQPFTPCSLADAARHGAGLAFWARDADGNLHVIGSDPRRGG